MSPMNPHLQHMMPGIGQPITPQQLQQGLPMFQGQGATLGNPAAAQADQQNKLVQMLEAYKANAGAMPQSDYAEGSGGLGALAMMAEAYGAKRETDGKGSVFGGMFGGKKK